MVWFLAGLKVGCFFPPLWTVLLYSGLLQELPTAPLKYVTNLSGGHHVFLKILFSNEDGHDIN